MAYVKGGKKCNLVTSWRKDWNSSSGAGQDVLLSQTFPINEDTHIASIFLNSYAPLYIPPTFCDIRATDGAGKPTGGNIDSKMRWFKDDVRGAPGTWKMYFYDQFPLLTPGQYAIVFSAPAAISEFDYYLLAQEGVNHYRAGKCWISWDGGATWERQWNRCFLFEVWGWTPPPDAPPEPVISNWAATDVDIEYTEDTVTLVVTTDIPVHLWMRWTLTEPIKHPSEEYRRGILLMSGVRWCFVNFKENEQEEDGDTLVHTFIKPDWPVCQTRWFYFTGQKQSVESPSASPIFHFHHVAVPISNYISLWHNRHMVSRHGTWSTARDGFVPKKDGRYQRPDSYLNISTLLVATYAISRCYLNFETQGIGAVTAARLGLYVVSVPNLTTPIHITKGLWDEPVIAPDFALQTDEVTDLGSRSFAPADVGQYCWIDLNPDGIAWINQSAIEINQHESYDWLKNSYLRFYQNIWISQSYTPQTTHTITSVRLRMRRKGTPGTLYITIKAADVNHKPTGPILASGTIDANTFITAAWGDWYLIALGGGATLNANTEYVIEAHIVGGGTSHYVEWISSTNSQYPAGYLTYSLNGGTSWSLLANWAAYFIEYETLQLGGTKFCLRTGADLGDNPPVPGTVFVVHFHSAQKGEGYLPLLEVTT